MTLFQLFITTNILLVIILIFTRRESKICRLHKAKLEPLLSKSSPGMIGDFEKPYWNNRKTIFPKSNMWFSTGCMSTSETEESQIPSCSICREAEIKFLLENIQYTKEVLGRYPNEIQQEIEGNSRNSAQDVGTI